MKRLRPFLYFEPATLSEAIKVLANQGGSAYPLAGGTDLLVRMKRDEITPSALVNLKRIEGLDQIKKESNKGINIGALTSISAIQHSPLIRSSHPILAQAAGLLGCPSIRNLGTLGGNIGRASPASDMAPSLIVLKARASIEGLQGRREVDLEKLFLGPGKIALSTAELIISFFIPKIEPYSSAVYLKLGRRKAMDCALVGVAVFMTLAGKNNRAKDVRVALSAVGPVPIRSKKAEEILLSGSLTERRFKEAARAASTESFPITDMRASAYYRKEMVRVLAFRAVSRALYLAQGAEKTN